MGKSWALAIREPWFSHSSAVDSLRASQFSHLQYGNNSAYLLGLWWEFTVLMLNMYKAHSKGYWGQYSY